MNNLGGNTDNTHLGDTKVLGDLEVRDDLIIDGGITITPPDCLNVDCIKPSTLNGDVSIKNSNEDTIIKLSNDKSVEISGSYKLPTTAGTEGQLLTADAGGLTSSFKDQVLPLTPSQEIGYIAIANTSYNTSRTLIWSSLGGTNQFSTDVLGIGGYVEFKSIGKIYTRRTQDGIISDTYRLEVDVVQTGGYVDTSTFTWSISDNVFVLNKDVDYERDYEFRFTIQKMNDNSFTIFGSGTATQLVNPTGTIQLPVQKIQFQDVKDSDSQLLFTDVATDVKLNVYFTAVQDPGVISSFVPFSGQFHAHQLGFLPEVVVNTSDHSALSNLSLGDSHTQYSLSNGRFGGQTLTGGTSITDKLVLQSNASDPLDGHVELKSFIDMQNNQIINVSTAGGIGQLVDGKLDKAGDTMTGVLKLPNGTAAAPALSFATAPTTGLSLDGFGKLLLSDSGTPSLKCNGANVSVFGTLSMNDNRLLEVATPVGPDDAANKQYVDDNALRIDGTLPMDGPLNMDSNNITEVVNVEGDNGVTLATTSASGYVSMSTPNQFLDLLGSGDLIYTVNGGAGHFLINNSESNKIEIKGPAMNIVDTNDYVLSLPSTTGDVALRQVSLLPFLPLTGGNLEGALGMNTNPINFTYNASGSVNLRRFQIQQNPSVPSRLQFNSLLDNGTLKDTIFQLDHNFSRMYLPTEVIGADTFIDNVQRITGSNTFSTLQLMNKLADGSNFQLEATKSTLIKDMDISNGKHIFPQITNTNDLGTSTKQMKKVYTRGVDSGDGGDLVLSHNGTPKLSIDATNSVLDASFEITSGNDFIYQKGAAEYYSDNSIIVTPLGGTATPTACRVDNLSTGFELGWSSSISGLNVPRFTYNGARKRVFHMGCVISFAPKKRDKECTFFLYKGTIAVPTPVKVPGTNVSMSGSKDNYDSHQSTAIHKMLVMETGDWVELWGQNDESADDFKVIDMNFFTMGLPNTIP